MGLDNGLGDGQAHAGSFDAIALVFSPIEFFEDEGCSGSSIPSPRSATLVITESPFVSAVMVIGWSAGE